MQIAQKNFYKKLLGRAGELKAKEYLENKGYTILEKNYKTHFGEIDLIAQEGDFIVFIEVKTRSNDDYGRPSEAVDFKKREKYFKVAQEYLIKHSKIDNPCRFDVVELSNGEINHIIDAFSL